MKKIKYLLVLIIGLFLTTNVYANDIKKINMEIYVDNSGTAHVTEEWTANLSSGTEGYKPYYNFGNSEFKNFKVSMENKDFTSLSSWNVNGSFEDKAYKSGINYISNGLELCFGISEYGTNTYVMKYDITNFITKLNDADMLYWTLMPYDLSDKPEEIYIKIYSDFKYEDTLDVWGYGNYGGYAYVYDGYIELSKEDGLESYEYMTVLVKFPLGTFNTENEITEDFDYYYMKAEEGSTSYDGGSWSDFTDDVMPILMVIFSIALFPLAIIFMIFKNVNLNAYGTKNLVFEKGMKKLNKDIPYFRDIPCNKDIYKAYWIAGNFNLMKRKNDFLGALILKWLKEDRVQNVKVTSKWLKKETTAIKFMNNENLSGSELAMYKMMFDASSDGVLEANEFKKYCENHYTKVLNWFDEAFDDGTDKYIGEGLIEVRETKKFLGTKKEYVVNSNVKEEAARMKGLKSFLKEFSNIKDRESIEVKLWEYYLMYAQIFGIAKKVAEEFKNLYPDVITDDYYNNMIFIHTFSNTAVNAASSAKSRAESYSSGGGGFSSGGGGGGSFGGGGGGGGFR